LSRSLPPSFKGAAWGLAAFMALFKITMATWLSTASQDKAQGDGVLARLLPVEQVEVQSPPLTPAAAATGAETILVIEDDEAVREVTQLMLKSLGIRCWWLATALKRWSWLTRRRPDSPGRVGYGNAGDERE